MSPEILIGSIIVILVFIAGRLSLAVPLEIKKKELYELAKKVSAEADNLAKRTKTLAVWENQLREISENLKKEILK